MTERITSTSNKGVRQVRELMAKAKARRESGLCIAEGERICTELAPERIERLYVADRYAGSIPEVGERLLRVSDSVMDHMADTQNSQGILAVVRQQKSGIKGGDFFLLLETIQDPGNLGTIFRTAEAAGVSGIFMNRECADVYAPKVVRATMGAVFRVPFLVTDELAAVTKRLQKGGVRVYAAHLRGTHCHYEADYRTPCAFMIGNEGNGLTEQLAALADEYIRIPMQGKAESLNAAAASAILMYEAVRQRQTPCI